jgi:hypothetical protein
MSFPIRADRLDGHLGDPRQALALGNKHGSAPVGRDRRIVRHRNASFKK